MDSQTTVDQKIKLVRVVLFLDWNDRDEWKDCLENAVKIASISIGEQTIGLEGYTGQFSQYPLLSDSDVKLFENYDLWRFLEVGKENDGGVFIDSYVVFCSEMKRNGGMFWIDSLKQNYTQDDDKWVGGIDTEYQNIDTKSCNGGNTNFFYWFSLPYPSDLVIRINGAEKENFLIFHHLKDKDRFTCEKVKIVSLGGSQIDKKFGKDSVFSSSLFLKEYVMRTLPQYTFVYYPNEGYVFFDRFAQKNEGWIYDTEKQRSIILIKNDGGIPGTLDSLYTSYNTTAYGHSSAEDFFDEQTLGRDIPWTLFTKEDNEPNYLALRMDVENYSKDRELTEPLDKEFILRIVKYLERMPQQDNPN